MSVDIRVRIDDLTTRELLKVACVMTQVVAMRDLDSALITLHERVAAALRAEVDDRLEANLNATPPPREDINDASTRRP